MCFESIDLGEKLRNPLVISRGTLFQIHRSKTVTDGSIVLDSFAIAKQSFHVWHYSKYYDFVIKRGERFGYERYTFLVLLVVCDHKYRSNRTIRQWIFVNYYYNFQTDLHTFIKSWKEQEFRYLFPLFSS